MSDEDDLTYSVSTKLPLSKIGGDLFDENSYKVKQKVVSAKRLASKKKEDWEIYEDGKSVLLLKGTRFTSKEKEFLRKPDGLVFLIRSFKDGLKSVVKIKEKMKDLV